MNSYSQNKEDVSIQNYFDDFVGTLLSIGENDGKTISNSLALIDKGWKAVLVEPSPTAFKKLSDLHRNNSNVLCFNTAIGDFNGDAEFYESGEHLGVGDSALLSTLDVKETERWGNTAQFNKINVPVITFLKFETNDTESFIKKTFDFISIDAEGYDLRILKQIDLIGHNTSMVIIEWNGKDFNEFDNYFKGQGFKLYLKNIENLIYVSISNRIKKAHQGKLVINSGGGVTSCFSVRLHDIVEYIGKYNTPPQFIDSTNQFSMYRDIDGQNISRLILSEYVFNEKLPFINFNHGWQYGWYNEIQIEILHKMANIYCPLSDMVMNRVDEMESILGDRVAILYRGNDKGLEIQRTPYQAMAEMADATGKESFLVQTDEEDFYEWFKLRYPNTICFDSLPRISKDPDSYVMPPIGGRAEFAVNFLAALKTISLAEHLIMNTGNTGMWAAIFRGTPRNIYQWHGNNHSWRKF